MVFQCINIRQDPWEVLKTAAFSLGFQHLPRDLANVNAWKTMFDPYNEGTQEKPQSRSTAFPRHRKNQGLRTNNGKHSKIVAITDLNDWGESHYTNRFFMYFSIRSSIETQNEVTRL